MNTITSKNMFTVDMSINKQLYNALLVSFERAKYNNVNHHVKPDNDTLKAEMEKDIDISLMYNINELIDEIKGNEEVLKKYFNCITLNYHDEESMINTIISINFEVTDIINNFVYVNATNFETWIE